MDLFSVMKSEVFRPFASIVLPGSVCLSPFAIIFGNSTPEVQHLFHSEPVLAFALYLGVGTLIGLLLENVGTSIERGVDQCIEKEYLPGHSQVWQIYLATDTKECNGRRYLTGIVTRLKFINSFLPAVFFFSIGLVWLQADKTPWSWFGVDVSLVLLALLLIWLFRSSTELSEVASFARAQMIGGQVPPQYDSDAHPVGRQRHFAYVISELVTSRVAEINLSGKSVFCVVPAMCHVWLGRARNESRKDNAQNGDLPS